MKKNIGLLLLAFGAIATTIYGTTGSGKEKRAVGQLKPCSFPDYVRSCRLDPLLQDSNPLTLSTAQQADIATVIKKHQSAMKPLLRSLAITRKTIHQDIRSGTYDEQAMQKAMSGLVTVMTDALVERERLDAKIYSFLSREQQLQAEELSRLADTFFDGKIALAASESVVAGRMKHFLCLTEAQAGNVDRAVEEALRKLSPILEKGENSVTEINFVPRLPHFCERETRKLSRLQAERMSRILIASENVTAKLYGSLQQNQKARTRDTVEFIEFCMRERIIELQLAKTRQSAEPAKAECQPTRPPLRLPALCASTSMRH